MRLSEPHAGGKRQKASYNSRKKSSIGKTALFALIFAVAGSIGSIYGPRLFNYVSLNLSFRDYISEEGRFTVLMPKNVDYQVQQVNTPGGLQEIHLFSARSGSFEYLVSYADYPEWYISSVDHATVLDGGRDGMVNNVFGELSVETILEVQDFPAREILIKAPQNSALKARIILAGNRLYMINVGSQTDNIYSHTVDKVLRSFKILS
ncbi:hypothetical protein ACFL6Q_05745 [Candidatus Neomarinimicrobiota bacterium]